MRAITPSTLYSPPPPLPTAAATTEPRQFLLRFASVVHPEFQMGASAWCLQDLFGTVIAQNSMPMKQDYPSVARGEYEGLLHGLEVARSLNVKNLIIQCSSEIIAAHLSGQTNLLFHTMYNQIEDLIPSIQFLLNKFQKVVVDLVSVGTCSHVLRLAEDTIDEAVMSKYSPRQSDISLSTRASSPVYEPGADLLSLSVPPPPGLGFDRDIQTTMMGGSMNYYASVNDNKSSVAGNPLSKSLIFPSISELSPWLVCNRDDDKLQTGLSHRMDQSMLF